MKEINLQTNQFLNLTAQGVANTKILLQNQGPDVMYIFKQSTAPTMTSPAMALFNWQSVEVDNSGGDIWVASQQAGTIFVTPTSDLGVASTVEFPPDLYTSTIEGFRRLRVDLVKRAFSLVVNSVHSTNSTFQLIMYKLSSSAHQLILSFGNKILKWMPVAFVLKCLQVQ